MFHSSMIHKAQLTDNVFVYLVSIERGWTVIQKREDGSLDFNKLWNDYKNGFGGLKGKHGQIQTEDIKAQTQSILEPLLQNTF